uniref:Uncharacterized protein n=1 Tax=Anguilla anguilla TaxID=7936 RepID=A0A0E9X6K1_ANGAN
MCSLHTYFSIETGKGKPGCFVLHPILLYCRLSVKLCCCCFTQLFYHVMSELDLYLLIYVLRTTLEKLFQYCFCVLFFRLKYTCYIFPIYLFNPKIIDLIQSNSFHSLYRSLASIIMSSCP